jgi:hypothetical protein
MAGSQGIIEDRVNMQRLIFQVDMLGRAVRICGPFLGHFRVVRLWRAWRLGVHAHSWRLVEIRG